MKTNLVVVFTDEQSIGTLGCYGNPLISTPNLDALASRSVLFDRAYVTQPVCTASRSSILTGLYPHTNGCTENNLALDPSIRAFPELIDSGGWACGYVGKWHLGDELSAQHGFFEWVSIEDAYRRYASRTSDPSSRSDYDQFLRRNGFEPDVDTGDGIGMFSRGFAARLPENLTKAHFVGSKSVEFVERHRDEPFVLFANFLEPHMPFFGPRDGQYAGVDVPLPVSFDDELADKPLKTRLFSLGYRNRGQSGVGLDDEEGWKTLIRRYWGLVSLVDEQVGRILDAIRSNGIGDRTVVVFTSDHGDMMGAHRLVGKCVMFEEAIRVPLMVAFPDDDAHHRWPSPSRFRLPVSQIDLVPTLLDIIGAGSSEGLEGESLMPRLADEERQGSEVVIEWNGMNNGFGDVLGDTAIIPEWLAVADELEIKAALDDPVRTLVTREGLKYTWSHREEDSLYDLNGDPAELKNLIGSADASLVNDLRARIEAWQTRTLDPVVFG